MERIWREWRRDGASQQSGEIAAAEPLELHIELNQGVSETLDEIVRSRRHDLKVMAMPQGVGHEKCIIALALFRSADGDFVDAGKFVTLGTRIDVIIVVYHTYKNASGIWQLKTLSEYPTRVTVVVNDGCMSC